MKPAALRGSTSADLIGDGNTKEQPLPRDSDQPAASQIHFEQPSCTHSGAHEDRLPQTHVIPNSRILDSSRKRYLWINYIETVKAMSTDGRNCSIAPFFRASGAPRLPRLATGPQSGWRTQITPRNGLRRRFQSPHPRPSGRESDAPCRLSTGGGTHPPPKAATARPKGVDSRLSWSSRREP